MAESPVQLSATALRIAGHVGQTALDRIAGGGATALAELDQHLAAVRAELADCQQPPAAGPGPRSAAMCPDVPFTSSALHAEPTVPVKLLLHYACGFVEAAVKADWWPAESTDASDWTSLRLAAICLLICRAEAAAELHPDLRPIA
jgi:hypothetical protein